MDGNKKKALSWKWSPANEFKEHDRSVMKDKYKVLGNEITNLVLNEGMVVHETKREENNMKLGNREIIGNITKNPFLKNNYLEDIMNQEAFLTPKNSNQQLRN
jgi:hypothetical protein